MSHPKRSYVEHVAIRVKDIHWHIRFFREVLGMTVRDVDGPVDDPRQLWTVGGGSSSRIPVSRGPKGASRTWA
jgi:hypothetical protein